MKKQPEPCNQEIIAHSTLFLMTSSDSYFWDVVLVILAPSILSMTMGFQKGFLGTWFSCVVESSSTPSSTSSIAILSSSILLFDVIIGEEKRRRAEEGFWNGKVERKRVKLRNNFLRKSHILCAHSLHLFGNEESKKRNGKRTSVQNLLPFSFFGALRSRFELFPEPGIEPDPLYGPEPEALDPVRSRRFNPAVTTGIVESVAK